MLVLTIPWLLLLLLVITVVFLLKKRWKATLLLLLVTFAINWWTDCFCYGFKNTFSGDLKVLTFNINGEGEYDEEKTSNIVSLIFQEDPDIVFLTENFIPIRDTLLARLHNMYPYDTRYMAHNIILGKYPLYNEVFYEKPNKGSGYIVNCCVKIGNKEISLFGCHLSSNNYSPELDYLTPEELNNVDEVRSYLSHTKKASVLRELESDSIVSSISERDCAIVMGDMNDICGSACMRIFKNAGLKDAWSEGGFGYGATIHHPLPYRIDHILYGNGLKLKGIKKIDTRDISDHDALVAVFDL